MKIRSSFVSNSSSCSFVICGFKISDEEYDYEGAYSKITGKTKEQIIELANEYNSKVKYPYKNINDAVRSFCEDALYRKPLFDSKDIRVESGEGVGGTIVGKSICTMSNEEFLDYEDMDIENLVERIKEIRDKIGCDDPIKIFVGTKCC